MNSKHLAVLLLAVCLAVVRCGSETKTNGSFSLVVTSTDINTTTQIGTAFVGAACGGADTSPQVSWSGNIPTRVRSFAISMTDVDKGDFVQVMMYNIPTSVRSLVQGATTPTGATLAINGNSNAAYEGPCPLTGVTHRYDLTVWGITVADLATAAGSNFTTGAAILATVRKNSAISGSLRSSFTGP